MSTLRGGPLTKLAYCPNEPKAIPFPPRHVMLRIVKSWIFTNSLDGKAIIPACYVPVQKRDVGATIDSLLAGEAGVAVARIAFHTICIRDTAVSRCWCYRFTLLPGIATEGATRNLKAGDGKLTVDDALRLCHGVAPEWLRLDVEVLDEEGRLICWFFEEKGGGKEYLAVPVDATRVVAIDDKILARYNKPRCLALPDTVTDTIRGANILLTWINTTRYVFVAFNQYSISGWNCREQQVNNSLQNQDLVECLRSIRHGYPRESLSDPKSSFCSNELITRASFQDDSTAVSTGINRFENLGNERHLNILQHLRLFLELCLTHLRRVVSSWTKGTYRADSLGIGPTICVPDDSEEPEGDLHGGLYMTSGVF
ncbi:hypothetical protein EYR40_000213 [Pleurotus pulmonarius]|nr:hypothetical protein EYR40_000213 [Pleurotus pulmonarius]